MFKKAPQKMQKKNYTKFLVMTMNINPQKSKI